MGVLMVEMHCCISSSYDVARTGPEDAVLQSTFRGLFGTMFAKWSLSWGVT